MSCEVGKEQAARYLVAVELVAEAKRRMECAPTITVQEDAATQYRRLEAHRLYAARELVSHCTRHGCRPPGLTGQRLPMVWYEGVVAELARPQAIEKTRVSAPHTESGPQERTPLEARTPGRVFGDLCCAAGLVITGCISGYIIFLASA